MSIKRTIITTIVALALVATVVPAGASADTLSDLMAQIAALQAQIAALQGGSTATAGTGVCAGVTFSRNLTVGSTGTDVKCLQQILSVTPQSGYFGPLTLAAVRSYQTEKGFTPANQVGPMTRAALNAGLSTTTPTTPTTPGVTTTGVEGSITGTVSPSPASGSDVYTGQSVAVSAVDVKATSSDVAINRVDLNFNTRPWLYISNLTVSDGTTSKSVAVTQSNSTEVTIGSDYSVRIDGVGIVVPVNTTKKLTFTVTGVGSLPAGETSKAVIATVKANSIRGTDGAGLSQTAPTDALTTRTFTVKTADTGTLTVSAASDTPKDHNVIVSETAQTDVALLKFNVEAKSNDVIVRNVNINVTTSTSTLATMMPAVKLLDGSTELASTSTAASSTFGGLSILIPKGTTKTLTVVGTLAKTNGSATAEGDWVAANLRSSADAIDAEDATTFAAADATADITAYKAYAFLKAPTFAYVSSSVTPIASLATGSTTPQSANYELKFNVTATGGDIYVRHYDGTTAASSGIVATSTSGQVAGSSTITATFTSNATDGTYSWKVGNGETKTFTVTATSVSENYASSFFEGIGVLNTKWGTSDVDVDGSFNTQTWGIEDLKTGQVLLNARL